MSQKVLSIIGVTVLVLGFQNCAKASFSGTGSDAVVEKGALVDMDIEDESEGSVPQDSSPQVSAPPPEDNKKNPPPKDPPSHTPPTENETPVVQEEEDGEEQDGDGLVACILVRHGKSLKLGYVEESLEGVTSVAKSVCISRSACLQIVPQLFEVEGAYDRGYCKGNPNVKRLTDQQVQALVDKGLGN